MGMIANDPALIPIAAMARQLRVTQRWLRGEVISGRIPGLIAESRILVRPDVVRALLSRRAAGPEGCGDACLPDATHDHSGGGA